MPKSEWIDTSQLSAKDMKEACPKRMFFESASFFDLPDGSLMLVKDDKIVAGFFKKERVMGYWEKVLNDYVLKHEYRQLP